MSDQPQLLYKNRYVEGIANIDTWIEHGGYESFRKALTMTPEAIIDEIKIDDRSAASPLARVHCASQTCSHEKSRQRARSGKA